MIIRSQQILRINSQYRGSMNFWLYIYNQIYIYIYINFQLNHPTIKYTYLRSKVSLETVRVT